MVILTPISSTFSIDTSSKNLVCSHVLKSRLREQRRISLSATTERTSERPPKSNTQAQDPPNKPTPFKLALLRRQQQATTGLKRALLSYKISQSEIYLYSEHFTFSTITFDPEELRRRRQHLSYTPRPPCSDSIKEEVQRSHIG